MEKDWAIEDAERTKRVRTFNSSFGFRLSVRRWGCRQNQQLRPTHHRGGGQRDGFGLIEEARIIVTLVTPHSEVSKNLSEHLRSRQSNGTHGPQSTHSTHTTYHMHHTHML